MSARADKATAGDELAAREWLATRVAFYATFGAHGNGDAALLAAYLVDESAELGIIAPDDHEIRSIRHACEIYAVTEAAKAGNGFCKRAMYETYRFTRGVPKAGYMMDALTAYFSSVLGDNFSDCVLPDEKLRAKFGCNKAGKPQINYPFSRNNPSRKMAGEVHDKLIGMTSITIGQEIPVVGEALSLLLDRYAASLLDAAIKVDKASNRQRDHRKAIVIACQEIADSTKKDMRIVRRNYADYMRQFCIRDAAISVLAEYFHRVFFRRVH